MEEEFIFECGWVVGGQDIRCVWIGEKEEEREWEKRKSGLSSTKVVEVNGSYVCESRRRGEKF